MSDYLVAFNVNRTYAKQQHTIVVYQIFIITSSNLHQNIDLHSEETPIIHFIKSNYYLYHC